MSAFQEALQRRGGPVPRPDTAVTFGIAGEPGSSRLRWLVGGLKAALEEVGHRYVPALQGDLRLVLNIVDPARPRPFRRKAQATFVVSLTEVQEPPDDVLRAGYPILIRSLSNLLLYLVSRDDSFELHFVTLEQGTYPIPFTPGDEAAFFAQVRERLLPLACSNLVVNNIFDPDLPEALWSGNATTEALRRAGQRLDALDLLPAPFPIQELLPARDFRHVQRLYGIGGLSYGNLSARHEGNTFWMSASGVNKADLRVIGQDILLVKGYDPAHNAIRLSVPPGVEPRRVSVDAIEHWLIYTEHPQVGAIVHVHAWMDGVRSTEINYPCGTLELGQAVAELVRQSPDPARAVVGLKNHGLTITGPSLEDIFDRIEGRILRQVPMS